jgi:YfiH family protein
MMMSATSLADLPGIRHAFFTRSGGVSRGLYASLNGGLGSRDDRDNVLANRARMAAALGVAADRLLTPIQTHSANAVVVEKPWPLDMRPRADAVVTRSVDLAIGVGTADCGAILFADPHARVIGAAHAGWKGALTGILEATIALMEMLGADRTRVLAALGPMIRQASYEVGPEFVARFRAADAGNARFFAASPRPDHAMFDLAGYIAARLAAAGITRFEDLGQCTYAQECFFSYRRSVHRGEPDYGRHINAIVLRK